MVLTDTGLAKVFQRIKSFVIAQLNSKASAIHTHTYSEIVDLPNGIAVDSTLDGTSSNAIANSAVSNALDGKIPKAGGAVMTGVDISRNVNDSSFGISGGMGLGWGGTIGAYGKDAPNRAGYVQINCDDGVNSSEVLISPSGSFTFNYNNTLKYVAMSEDVIPRSVGSVITGTNIGRVDNTGNLDICGGTTFENGGFVALRGKNTNITGQEGAVVIGANNGSVSSDITIYPDAYASCLLDLRPSVSGTYNLGTSSKKWKTINGVDPGALSLPDHTAGVNITSLIVDNKWTATADGWVSVFGYAGTKPVYIYNAGYNGTVTYTLGNGFGAFPDNSSIGSFCATAPVRNGQTLRIYLSSTGTSAAYFFPCAGNI